MAYTDRNTLPPPVPGVNRRWDGNKWTYYNPTTGKVTDSPEAASASTNDVKRYPQPVYPDVSKTDPTLQDQEAQLRRTYAEFLARQGLDRSNYMGNFALQARDIDQANERATTDTTDDFASRRLLKSGLFAKAQSRVADDFNNRRGQMENDRANFESGLNQSLIGFQGDQDTALLKARQDAIARRAQQPGMPVGTFTRL